jgi:hypothetical protein
MHLPLPDGWTLAKEEPSAYSQPYTAMFNKTGALAFLLLTRERLESSSTLYGKLLEANLGKHDDFKKTADMSVTRDGITGTRWNVEWKENGVTYTVIIEFFSVGDDHYRVTAFAPSEVYGRYTQDFENMFRSVRFPLLHVDPRLLPSPNGTN